MVQTAPDISVNEQWERPRKALYEHLRWPTSQCWLETPGHWFRNRLWPFDHINFLVLLSTKNALVLSVVVQQARLWHQGCTHAGVLGWASKEKPTKHMWSHSWGSSRYNYMSNQLLLLMLLTLEREREGQRGATKWCLLDHLFLHRSTNIEMQCRYAEQVTAALERNPPHRTLCFLLVCVPYCFSLQPPSENQGKNRNENLVLLTAKVSHLNKHFRAVSNDYFMHV